MNLPIYPSLYYLVPLAIVSFIVLFLVFLGLSVVFVKLLTDASSVGEKEKRRYEEASDILETARKQAFGLVQDANIDAGKILEDANIVSQGMSDNLSSRISGVAKEQSDFISESSDNLLKVYRKAMLEASKGNLDSINKLSEDFKDELSDEVSQFRKSMETAALESHKTIEKELEEYKAMRIKDIDRAVYKAIQDASFKIIGKALSLEDQEEFIVRSLEEAKLKGVL